MPESTGGLIQNAGTAIRPDGKKASPDEYYKVKIYVAGDEALMSGGAAVWPMVANIPERFHMELTSNWGTPFNGAGVGDVVEGAARMFGLNSGGALGKVTEYAAGAAGVGTKAKSQSFQVWENTSPLNLNLDLVFYAEENTEREIKARHLALLKLCAPSEVGGQLLIAPGPVLLSKSPVGGSLPYGGRQISIAIGGYLFFENVVINAVGSDVVTLCDSSGKPIAMTVNISFSTWNACITGADLDKIFV